MKEEKREKWLELLRKEWEREWKQEKNQHVIRIHNRLLKILVDEKAHYDEVIIATELLLQEALIEKRKFVRKQSQLPRPKLSDEKSVPIKPHNN